MTKNQIYNLYIFITIMLLDKSVITNISPDYLKEKSLLFLNTLGKYEFIQEPAIWGDYCNLWKIDKDDYKIMNIINFLFAMSKNQKKLLKNFEKYIGNTKNISNLELKHFAHKKLIECIDDKGFVDTRFMKLKTLKKMINWFKERRKRKRKEELDRWQAVIDEDHSGSVCGRELDRLLIEKGLKK